MRLPTVAEFLFLPEINQIRKGLDMKSHEVLKQVCKKKGAKNVAAHLNLSLATVHQWSRPSKPKGSGIINPLDRIAAIQDFTGDTQLVEWICEQAGGFFVRNPRVSNGKPPELLDEENNVFEVSGETMSVIAKSARDKKITADEAKKIRRYWEHEKSVKEHFVVCCEERDFESLAAVMDLHMPAKSPAPAAASSAIKSSEWLRA